MPSCRHRARLFAAAILVTPALSIGAQSLADLARSKDAIQSASVSIDLLVAKTQELQQQIDVTLKALEQSKKDVERVQNTPAATEIGALAHAVEQLQKRLAEQVATITRIQRDGAGAKGDPVGATMKAIDEALAGDDAAAQAKRLRRLAREVEDERGRALVHYHVGEAHRRIAEVEQSRGRVQQALGELKRAADHYEKSAACDEDLDSAVGTSLLGSARCRLVQVESAMCRAYWDSFKRSGNRTARSHANRLRRSVSEHFAVLEERHLEDWLDEKENVVHTAYADVHRLANELGVQAPPVPPRPTEPPPRKKQR